MAKECAGAWYTLNSNNTQECTFVERPDACCEDDGWLLTFVFDAKRNTSRLVILDGLSISRGPICTIHLPHYLPLGMHSSWSKFYYGPAATAPQLWAADNFGTLLTSPCSNWRAQWCVICILVSLEDCAASMPSDPKHVQ